MSRAFGLRRNRWRWVLDALLMVGLLAGLHVYQTRDLVRGPAPDFAAQLLDGSPIRLADYRGRPLLLHFWASWCPVCRLEEGAIAAIAERYQVLTVALDDMDVAQLRRWLDERGVSYPVVRDATGQIAGRYGVTGVPSSIIIDAAGDIRFVASGYTTQTGLRLRLWWAGR